MDQIGDEKNTDERWTEKVALDSALSRLNDREKKILYLRYYEGKTQTEISSEIGLSQAQVSRLEKNALKSIKSKVSYWRNYRRRKINAAAPKMRLPRFLLRIRFAYAYSDAFDEKGVFPEIEFYNIIYARMRAKERINNRRENTSKTADKKL